MASLVIKCGSRTVDKKAMTRRTSDLPMVTRVKRIEDAAGGVADPPGNNANPVLGEIISIRPRAHIETGEAFHDSAARLRALLSSLDDLVFELDGDGVYLSIWTTNETLLVAPPSELLGRSVSESLDEAVGRRVTQAVRRVLESGRPEFLDYRLDVPVGARWFQARLAPIAGSAAPSVCLLVRDITDQKAAEDARDDAERRLRHLATHDALTGLPNRSFFSDRLDRALKRTRRRHEELVVLVLDVDRFKDINDTHGHAAGDAVLQEVARRLVGVTRDGDSIARLGGDEFAILLPGATEAEGGAVAARVSECLKDPIAIGPSKISVCISTGFAVFPRDGAEAEALFRRADAAMYVVKREHRAREAT